MGYKFNPFTGKLDLVGSGGTVVDNGNIEGGSANSVYLISQVVDGGTA